METFRGHQRFFDRKLSPPFYSSPRALSGLPSIAIRLRRVIEDRAPNRQASSYFRRYLAPSFSKPPCRQDIRRASSSPTGRLTRRFVIGPQRTASASPAPFVWSTRREGNSRADTSNRRCSAGDQARIARGGGILIKHPIRRSARSARRIAFLCPER